MDNASMLGRIVKCRKLEWENGLHYRKSGFGEACEFFIPLVAIVGLQPQPLPMWDKPNEFKYDFGTRLTMRGSADVVTVEPIEFWLKFYNPMEY